MGDMSVAVNRSACRQTSGAGSLLWHIVYFTKLMPFEVQIHMYREIYVFIVCIQEFNIKFASSRVLF